MRHYCQKIILAISSPRERRLPEEGESGPQETSAEVRGEDRVGWTWPLEEDENKEEPRQQVGLRGEGVGCREEG